MGNGSRNGPISAPPLEAVSTGASARTNQATLPHFRDVAAPIPKIFEEDVTIISQYKIDELAITSGKFLKDVSVAVIGYVKDSSKDGIDIHHNNDGFILNVHFFTKIRER